MPAMFGNQCRMAASVFAVVTLAMIVPAQASDKENILHEFEGGNDGSLSYAGLIADGAGNLYGTTVSGGDGTGCYDGKYSGCGTVFKISGGGAETVLYAFAGGCDGAYPEGGVISDPQGNLYGATNDGGACNSDQGYGTVFKLAPDGVETVLYAFQMGTDGSYPLGNLVRDKDGNLFGTTPAGGDMAECGGSGCGVVFEVAPTGGETVLHAFKGGADGSQPVSGLIMDNSGNLFGTTSDGGGSTNCVAGISGCGTVFEVAPDGTETILYAFQGGTDGCLPEAGLISDSAGDLFGTTWACGAEGYGTVFEVTPAGSETILHSFEAGLDGEDPLAGLVMDKTGNLYGTTPYGGAGTGCKKRGSCGTVFEVTPNGHEKVLYAFRNSRGSYPVGGLLLGAHNDLYGTTAFGGKANYGVVFELKK